MACTSILLALVVLPHREGTFTYCGQGYMKGELVGITPINSTSLVYLRSPKMAPLFVGLGVIHHGGG